MAIFTVIVTCGYFKTVKMAFFQNSAADGLQNIK